MRKKTPWLLCSALALTLAFSGPGFCSGSAVPAVTAYAQEMGAPENSAEDAGTEEKAAAAEDDRAAAEAEQKESTEAAETASADQAGEAVSETPAAADAAEDPDQEDPSGQDKKDPEEPEKKSGDGNEEDPAKTRNRRILPRMTAARIPPGKTARRIRTKIRTRIKTRTRRTPQRISPSPWKTGATVRTSKAR